MSKKKIIIASVVSAVVIAIMVVIIVVTSMFDPILTIYFSTVGGSSGGEATNHDFKSSYETKQALQAAQIETCNQIEAEGAVLIKNDNSALPLAEGTKVSVFGQHAHEMLTSGSGSGSIGDSSKTLYDILKASGLDVNKTLWDFYLNNGVKSLGHGPALTGSAQTQDDWSINECPSEKYNSEVKSSYSSYNGAAIVVISRTGGEGGDLPRDMSKFGGTASEHYLELCKDEKDLLKEVTDNFNRVIVLLNTNNAIELGFLKEYGIDACIYIGGTGQSGNEVIGDLLIGKINPSGHLVDTYVYDNFSSPAAQNFGDYKYSNADYNYVVYSEGIYVGYRYYETRYADVIMKAENVGNYDYDKTVVYPFGHGLSYTTFEWTNFDYSYDEATDEFTFTLTVTNTGDYDGKEVVELYVQSPYEHGVTSIEKSAVELVGFYKTGLLEKKVGTEDVIIKVAKSALTSYDYKTAKTYVLEAGDYSFSVAKDAHGALNNILASKSYEVDGNSAFVKSYNQPTNDLTTYSKDAYTGTAVTNRFDYSVFDGMKQLSRNNWAAVEAGLEYKTLEISAGDKAQAELKGKQASRNPDWNKKVSAVTVGAPKKLTLAEVMEIDTDEAWQSLVEQISLSDLNSLFCMSGYKTKAIESVDKPVANDSDGPGGISTFIGGADAVRAYGYPTETIIACTWNEELAEKMGDMVGEDGLSGKISGWYAPAMDTHRTPFGGRNFEYYSEDGFISGKIGAAVVKGAQTKGLYCYIKHFALNEQETNRGDYLHTWANEQAIREIYLKPYMITVQEGEAHGIMTAQDNIGVTLCYGNYNLITDVLKNEWGFKGMVITDYTWTSAEMCEQVLYAGGDLMLQTIVVSLSSRKTNETQAQLQRAAKNVLWTVAHSNAMNGYGVGTAVKAGFPVYKILVIVVDCLLGAGLIVTNLLLFVILPRRKKVSAQTDEEQVDKYDNIQ